MPWSEIAMLTAVENCWRIELAESAVAAKRKLWSFSMRSTRPAKAGLLAR